MSHKAGKIAPIIVGLLLVGVVLIGCAAATEPNEMPAAVEPSASEPAVSETPAPTNVPSSPNEGRVDPREAAYAAAIANWLEPLPSGYSWPLWADLPHVGSGQLREADNASGVYRCILISAAWHAYFEANDPVASRDYATRADVYVIPDNPSILPVTKDGSIIDHDLAAASGICKGISGDLPIAGQ